MTFIKLPYKILLENLPDEILVAIFGNLTVKDKIICSKVSQKFQLLCNDKSLWTKINLSHQKEVSSELISQVLEKDCEKLDLSFSTYKGGFVPFTKNKLKVLYLRNCQQYDPYAELDQQFIPNLVESCSLLEKLCLEQFSGPQFDRVTRGICKSGQTLTSLNLSGCSNIHYSCIENIVIACVNLIEANFSAMFLSDYALSFICKKLTIKIEKISLADQQVVDKDIDVLVKRCLNLSALNMRNTNISGKSVLSVTNNLSSKLVRLELPEFIEYDQLISLNSMEKLAHLWMAPRTTKEIDDPNKQYEQTRINHDLKLGTLFPNLKINKGKLLIAEQDK